MVGSVRAVARDARRALREGPEGIQRRQRERLADAVAYARANAPFYRELYRDLPDRVTDPTLLPVTDKKLLMANFDEAVTDRAVTLAKVEEFVADPARAGERFTDAGHLVATTSGTSGVRGLFVLDDHSSRVIFGLGRRSNPDLGLRGVLRLLARGGRTALLAAPPGHFYTYASTARMVREHRRLAGMMRMFSIQQPLPELVAELNAYRPAMLGGFLSSMIMLAAEQEAGRLAIDPVLVLPGGETVTDQARARIERAFGARIRSVYGSTECYFLSTGCSEHWYHVNADWAVLEPVDAEHRPVPPGEPSHTVLISNLANRVQPFLRYDLGDSVVLRPDPCPCGNPLPAVRVQGRAADLLAFPGVRAAAELSPMLFGTLLDRIPGLDRYQVIQTAPTVLRVRLQPHPGADPDEVWCAVRDGLDRVLAEHGVTGVALDRATELPERTTGGKVRRIVPLPA
ncbi:phenylacetate--CoA ligase family protein [Microlunatus sp. GCM10028923]|uniref:phenylacetate--CoA ligase family protein n=1 Tax=Microlunatus sp. GCM10028923 TaxID=3273400 RepID=UPI00361B379A